MANKYPKLAEQWSDKNFPLTPEDVSYGSNRSVWWKGNCGHEWKAIVKNRVNGAGCPYCSSNRLLKGFNDLASVKPELIVEWSEKNDPLKPDMVMSCSNKIVWWKCVHGHEWPAKIADRYYGSGCPYCSGHLLYKGFNDLASNYPELAAEWSEKNLPCCAEDVFPKSTKMVWWKCRVCKHEWRAVINSRVKGSECPVCCEKEIIDGVNDLATTDPWILDEWDFERNVGLNPRRLSRHLYRTVWWKGKCGHTWRARIVDRVMDHEPCKICLKKFEENYPCELLCRYIEASGNILYRNYEDLIGLPLTTFIPAKKAAIEIASPEYNSIQGYQREFVKTDLCRKAHIKLIRIQKKQDNEFDGCATIIRKDGSDEALRIAIVTALEIIKVFVDINSIEDKDTILKRALAG